jgi:hypothetical protein
MLDDIDELLPLLTETEQARLDALLKYKGQWEPFPDSPQEAAFHSEADVTGIGGAAGGGKTGLMLGLAQTQHHRSIIFRRDKAQLEGIEADSYGYFAGLGRFNEMKHRWRLDDSKMVEFGGVNEEKDVIKYQGRAHDLVGFDELCHFSEYQFRFLSAWNRTTRDKQRCRVVAGFNPPTSAEGDWVIGYFAPWLDDRYAGRLGPAQPGELRWYAMLDGIEKECVNGQPFWWPPEDPEAELIEPKSRTFFPSRVEDNPILMARGYKKDLQALPEPLRSLMLQGKFNVAQMDDAWQVIPSEWIRAAQARWRDLSPEERGKLTQVGVDPARGGLDKTCIAKRYHNWFARVVKKPGRMTPDGKAVIKEVLEVMGSESAPIHVDVIGIGSSPVDIGRMMQLPIRPMNGSNGSSYVTKGTKLRMYNKRAEWHWQMRENLDPKNKMDIALPPERSVFADLAAPRYELTPRGIKIEEKADIKERIHRSPDEGEAIIYAQGKSGHEAVIGSVIITGQRLNIPG